MALSIVKTDDFETDLAQKTVKENSKINFLHLRSSTGLPVYNANYRILEQYVLSLVTKFNNSLKKYYQIEYSKSSALLDLNDPLIKHYNSRFPEKQFLIEGQYVLKPACCANAFKIWASKRTSLNKKQIIHQVSDCYRIESQGAIRSLKRNCYFTMPDYHMITVHNDCLLDFMNIRTNLIKFYEQAFGLNWKDYFIQVVRIDQAKFNTYESFLNELSQDTDLIVHKINREGPDRPYFELKYELSYKKDSKLFTLGTIQIDYEYPKLFELDESVLGPRPALHFTQGSIPRIIEVLIQEQKIPQLGLKLMVLNDSIDPLEYWSKLNLSASVLIDDTSKTISQSMKSSAMELLLYPALLVVGPNQLKNNTFALSDRVNKKNYIFQVDEFKEWVAKNLKFIFTDQINYTSTYANKDN